MKVLLQKQNKIEIDLLPKHEITKHYIFLDEVGRGCLAGPVVVAGVLWQPNVDYSFNNPPSSWLSLRNKGIQDSKKIAEMKRGLILQALHLNPIKNAFDVLHLNDDHFYLFVDQMEVTDIEEFNILSATMRLMGRVASQLALKARIDLKDKITIILDGREYITWEKKPLYQFQELPIPKSDALFAPCGLASLYAKVYRDFQMSFWNTIYPGYEFEKHKGYGTAKHLESIRSSGATPIHRRTFAGVKEFL